jgi:hypothetical protein
MRGQNLGGINQTEMTNLAALQKAIADLNAEQPLKQQEVQQQLQSEQAKALMNAQQYGLDYALKMADLTGNVEVSPGVTMPTLQAQQYQSNKALQEAGLTGTYNGQQTLAGAESQASTALKAAQLKELTDPNSITNQMNKLGLDTAKFNYAQLPIEAKQKADQIASDLASGRMSRAQAQATIDHMGDSAKVDSFTLDDWAKTLDAEFLPKTDSYGNILSPGVTDNVQREKRILDLNLDANMTAQLYKKYGIPIPQ